MGFGIGSFVKKTVGDVGGFLTTPGSAFTALGVDLFKKDDPRLPANATREQITTANLFRNLSPEQQKDLLLNNPNIVTALGEQRFDPLTNTLTLTESPFVEAQRQRQEALAAGLSRQLAGDLPSTDPSARFEEGRALFEPAFEQQRERLEQQLADKGIPLGSEAANRELNRLEESQGRQLRALALESTQTAEAQRAARFNEISSLLGTQQVGGIGFGQFQPGFSGLDLFGAEQAGLNRQFQAGQARAQRRADRQQAIIGALGSLGSSAVGAGGLFASDRRLKENIEKVGVSESGINIYEFDYINKEHGEGRYRGVMAQDLEDSHPEALIFNKDDTYSVNYGLIDVDFEKIA